MKKICFVTSSLVGPTLNGGVGTAMYYQALLLAEEGYDVTILFNGAFQVQNSNYWRKKYEELDIKFFFLPEEVQECKKEINKHNWWVWRSYYVMKWLEKNHFDIVHFAETCAYAFHTIQAKRTLQKFDNTKIVVTMHSPTQWIYEGDKRWPFEADERDRKSNLFLKLNYAERYVCEYTDLLLAPSIAVFKWAENKGWRLAKNRKMIFNPYLGQASVKYEGVDYNHLIFFGTLNKCKGLDFFCDAVRKYCNSISKCEEEETREFKVSFLGRNVDVDNTKSNDYIQRKLAGLNVNIEIHNDFDTFAANEYIKQSKGIAVMCSNLDNSPYSIVECIENRIPFICSNVGGIPEMVDERVLFSPNTNSLFKKICELSQLDWSIMQHKYSAESANESICQLNSQLLEEDVLQEEQVYEEAKVSICIAYYNHGKYIFSLLKSILRNNYNNYEVIIVNDGSDEEGSIEAFSNLMSKYETNDKFKFASIERNSKGKAYNIAANLASGKYLLFVDAETVVKPELLANLVYGIQKSNSKAVACHTQDLTGIGMPTLMNLKESLNIPIGAALEVGLVDDCFSKSLFMVEHSIYELLGGMDESSCSIPETCFLIKFVKEKQMLEIVPEVLAWSRTFGADNTYSYGNISEYEYHATILDAYFETDSIFMRYFMQNWGMARYENNYLPPKSEDTICKTDTKIVKDSTEHIVRAQILEKENKELNAKLVSLSAELRVLTKQNHELEAEKQLSKTQKEQLLVAVGNYEKSTCWKVTAPLRKLLDIIKRK